MRTSKTPKTKTEKKLDLMRQRNMELASKVSQMQEKLNEYELETPEKKENDEKILKQYENNKHQIELIQELESLLGEWNKALGELDVYREQYEKLIAELCFYLRKTKEYLPFYKRIALKYKYKKEKKKMR